MEVDDNTQIFDHAIRTADMLVTMFGSNCEVVVHDFKNLKKSLIHIAGNVTGRKIGSPSTDLILSELKKNPADIEDIPNYKTQSQKGNMMKSSTVFLRDRKQSVIGALCINYDVTQMMLFSADMEQFLSFDSNHHMKSENFYSTVQDVIQDMVDQVLLKFKKAPATLSLDEKIECVGMLEEKGAFLIKGSTEYLASVLGVSKFTIYNYLNKIRAQNEYHLENQVKT
ncbi:helix-turn-helix transcriptional regulator [Bacillus marasmi]|uniref:helix-turn-helix transcriptional regulator n=1 Tax=Bacillus marasmi TaxID=1926279 RepID=UPI0011C92D07|nr:PAS domain-containing protein [Bacillus marasmi]